MSGLRLVLVRHGITDWNREGRFQGHLDPPLSTAGRAQAELVAARIATQEGGPPARIVSSALRRASETADAIGEATGVPVEADHRWIEIGQGQWEGRTHDDIARTDPVGYERWRTTDGLPPGGETIASTVARLTAALGDVERSAERGRGAVVIVSHGGTMRVMARILLELGPERSWGLDVDNGSLSVLRQGHGAWAVERWNDTAHLLGQAAPTHADELEGRPLAL